MAKSKRNQRKSWKGYFLEFLMLFLAVTLGFMADNFREKSSERAKEKEYIQSMIEDVNEDRINAQEVIEVNTKRVEALDSLLNKSFNFNGTEKEMLELNRYFVQVLIHPEFLTPAELTMQQLKNAGGMRLIKSKKSINEILRYDTKLKKISNQQLYYENYQNKAIASGVKIFNIHELLTSIRSNDSNIIPDRFTLLETDPLFIKTFGNDVAMYKGIIEYYIMLLTELNEQGEVLIGTLKKEYRIR